MDAPHDDELEAAEAEAKAAARGLWAKPDPIPPWEWRRGANLPAELAGKVVANASSRIYHLPGCRNIPKIADTNRVVYDSDQAAESAGYQAGQCCSKAQ